MYQKNYESVLKMQQERTPVWPANEQPDAMGKPDMHTN